MFWLDGALSSRSILPFDVMDRGLQLGDGVFDTALVLGGCMIWRDAHVARLVTACGTLGFMLEQAVIDAAIDALTGGSADGVLRITVTRGSGARGLAPPKAPKPRVLAALAPLRTGFAFAPLTLQVSSIRRNETSPASRLKTLDYVDAIFAQGTAGRAGFDDALFLNGQGHVACATTGNIVALRGGRLLTPRLDDGVLPGTVRGVLLALCQTVGLEAHETAMTLADLVTAEAVFVTNSLKLMARVTRIDAVDTSSGAAGATLVAALGRAVREICGRDPRTLGAAT